ncbi:hypothetical protein Syun_027005 [Stephania yunnanensis]|uniref:Uncharacterized protein n=1 Tax=Stephania yunnanensis TaxID=152371 RepID=A0AAP0ENK9_9MAGN
MERTIVPKLEDMKGGGGSVKVGTTGTVGSLINRELQSIQQTPMPSKGKPSVASVSFPSTATGDARMHRRTMNEASTSSGSSSGSSNSGSVNDISHRNPGTNKRTVQSAQKSRHRVPMLGSDDVAVETPPRITKPAKKGANIVEVVDIKCGSHEKMWASPIASRLKKISFSKLSETII